jgi:hypothetical protein
MDAFVAKPIAISELYGAIARFARAAEPLDVADDKVA